MAQGRYLGILNGQLRNNITELYSFQNPQMVSDGFWFSFSKTLCVIIIIIIILVVTVHHKGPSNKKTLTPTCTVELISAAKPPVTGASWLMSKRPVFATDWRKKKTKKKQHTVRHLYDLGLLSFWEYLSVFLRERVHVRARESGRVNERADSVSAGSWFRLVQSQQCTLEALHSWAFAFGFSQTCHYRERMPLLHPLSTKAWNQ